MENRIILLLLFGISYINAINAQNLIPNGDFENQSKFFARDYCSISAVEDWHTTSGSSPEYFKRSHRYDERDCSTPNNIIGKQKPKSGKAYIGLFLFNYDYRFKKNARFFLRENVYAKLNKALIKDSTYIFTMYISLVEDTGYFSNKISVAFSNKIKKTKPGPYPLLSASNRLVFEDKKGFRDQTNWMKLTQKYQAKGNEKYIIIALFEEDLSKKQYWRMKKTNQLKEKNHFDDCYYFIDDVSLYPCW